MANSYIANINALAAKLDIIEESNGIFDDGVIPILEEIESRACARLFFLHHTNDRSVAR